MYFENTLNLLEPLPAEIDEAETISQLLIENELDSARMLAGFYDEFDYYFQKLYCLKDEQDLRDSLRFNQDHPDFDETGRYSAIIRRALGYPPSKNQTPNKKK